MLGYKYTTEQEAIDARQLCDNLKGFPKSGIEHYAGYLYSELDNFYYMPHYYDLEQVLGNPYEFTITFPEITL